jgi:hypothetical protein
MSSIFDLKTSEAELSSSNMGVSRAEYDQHPPTRDVVGSSFANGAIHFRFQTSGTKWWMPSKSYIRMRCALTKGDGTQLDTADGVGPNMDMMSNLFQSAEFRINDKTVSRISDFMPQVDMLEQRVSKSSSHIDTIGAATNWMITDANIRISEVSSDGTIIKKNLPVAPADTATTSVALGYDALAEIGVNGTTVTITKAGGANLPTGVFLVGDKILMTGGANDLQTYEVLAITTDTTATTVITIAHDWDLVAASADTFTRLRPNPVPTLTANSRMLKEFEMTWTPPLSIFKIMHALPGAKYELVLNPQTSSAYQLRAIESVGVTKTPWTSSANGDFRFDVKDMYLYVNTVEGPRADNLTYLLDLEQTRCQSEKIDNVSFAQKNFDVSPSAYALTVAYQDLRAGNSTLYSAAKFKSYGNALSSVVPQELGLNRFFVNYAGQNYPSPDADPSFVAGKDYTIQRYTETQIHTGAYYDTGGAESLDDFHDRGAYYHFKTPKDGTDRSTRVNVHQQFDNTTETQNLRCLLFDHSRQVARIQITDGRVTNVDLEDA